MKPTIILCLLCLATACQRDITPWESEAETRDVSLYMDTRGLTAEGDLPANYQIFLADAGGHIVYHNLTVPQESATLLNVKVPPGEYTAYCTSNAPHKELWSFSPGDRPEDVFLKTGQLEDGSRTAADHALGSGPISVSDLLPNSDTLRLERKVAKIRLIVHGMQNWFNDLKVHLSGFPQRMNLLGAASSPDEFTWRLPNPGTSDISVTEILVFPPAGEAGLHFSSDRLSFLSAKHVLTGIEANRIIRVTANLQPAVAEELVDITVDTGDWNTDTLTSGWTLEGPLPPFSEVEGYVETGPDLVREGGFEGTLEEVGRYWQVEKVSGRELHMYEISTSNSHSGSQALLVKGKTAVYQDIPVLSGEFYRISFPVNAPTENADWKLSSTWLANGEDLGIGNLRTEDNRGKTEGYEDPYGNQVYRAPKGATTLRLEIRNYGDTGTDDLFIDAVRAVRMAPQQ